MAIGPGTNWQMFESPAGTFVQPTTGFTGSFTVVTDGSYTITQVCNDKTPGNHFSVYAGNTYIQVTVVR